MRLKTDAKIYTIQNRNGSVTYRVDLGKDPRGKRITRGFSTREEAEEYKQKLDEKVVQKVSSIALADISESERHEILAAREKLKPHHATIAQAVDFSLKHARPVSGDITVVEAIPKFLAEKAKMRRSAKYLHNCEKIYFAPFSRQFGPQKVNDILGKDGLNYLAKQRWSNNTKNAHRNYLSTLYGWFIKKKYTARNPIEEIDLFPKTDPPIRVLSPDQVRALLNYAFKQEIYDACASTRWTARSGKVLILN